MKLIASARLGICATSFWGCLWISAVACGCKPRDFAFSFSLANKPHSLALSLFRCLDLGYAAGRTGGTAPAVLNAADEVAVEAFLKGRLPFLAIADVVEHTLGRHSPFAPDSLDAVLEADAEARVIATEACAAHRID